MESNLKANVSRYMSYLLRHNPQTLNMDKEGFVSIEELLEKIRVHYPINRNLILEIVEKSERKRFEIKEKKIRALYGHSIPVKIELEEDTLVRVLYHGTTPSAVSKILKEGLKPMKRRWVHLSPTKEIAIEIGKRRASHPVVLEIDVEAAREGSLRFYKATDRVVLSGSVPPKYIRVKK